MDNPYDWQGHHPKHSVARESLLNSVVPELLGGGAVLLLGGHGTGKSVFIRQVQNRLVLDGANALVIAAPPTRLTITSTLQALAKKLGVPSSEIPDPLEIFEAALRADARQIILLYDEADVYCNIEDAGTSVGRAIFNALEAARRELTPSLAILAAGGLGLFTLRESLGSNFISRAAWVPMSPLTRAEVAALAQPFRTQGMNIPEDVIESLIVASGRNAALVTYGFQCLWESNAKPSLESVISAFGTFPHTYPGFLRDFGRSLNDSELSNVPLKVWSVISKRGSPVSRDAVLEAISGDDPLDMNLDDALRMLLAAGLIEIEGPLVADPLVVRPLLSILTLQFSFERERPKEFVERLSGDLISLLEHIHSLGTDFYRPSSGIVPESVFSAILAIGLRQLGWDVEREALRSAGRTDLRVRMPGRPDVAVIEVKIWGRNDYRDIHAQVCSYWSADVVAGFAITLSASPPDEWPATYVAECLDAVTLDASFTETSSILAGHKRAWTASQAGMQMNVEHMFVAVPHRDR